MASELKIFSQSRAWELQCVSSWRALLVVARLWNVPSLAQVFSSKSLVVGTIMEAEGSSADGISWVKVGHGGMGFCRLDPAPDGWSAVVGGVYTIQPTTTNSTLPSLPWWTTALWKWSEVNLSALQLLPSGVLSGWLGSTYFWSKNCFVTPCLQRPSLTGGKHSLSSFSTCYHSV